jgi:hypothetical protein
LETVTERSGHKVLIEVDDNISLIVGDPEGILDWQMKPHLRRSLNIIISINYI